MERRSFFEKSGILLSVGALMKTLDLFTGTKMTALASSPLLSKVPNDNDRILVIIQLIGGNDGLNTVIPLEYYDNLAKLRKNILIPPEKILKITDTLGLHPSLKGFSDLFNLNELCIVQSVGYPDQNRSHFRSFDIWNSASPANEYWTTGWIGRYLEKFHSGYPDNYPNDIFPDPLAINLGNSVSETCQGQAFNFGFAMENPNSLSLLPEVEFQNELFTNNYQKELKFIKTNIHQSNAYTKVISNAYKKGKNRIEYPANNKLAQQLKIVSNLISGGLKTRIYVLTLGGFDTHANQTDKEDTCQGDHAEKLKMLSDALSAFQSDLKALDLDKRVLGLTTSEFGRQIMSNDSNGTDHGDAAPLFVFGTGIKNNLIGENPNIESKVPEQSSVNMQFDFRDVFASILINWLGMSSTDVNDIFHRNCNSIPIL